MFLGNAKETAHFPFSHERREINMNGCRPVLCTLLTQESLVESVAHGLRLVLFLVCHAMVQELVELSLEKPLLVGSTTTDGIRCSCVHTFWFIGN